MAEINVQEIKLWNYKIGVWKYDRSIKINQEIKKKIELLEMKKWVSCIYKLSRRAKQQIRHN